MKSATQNWHDAEAIVAVIKDKNWESKRIMAGRTVHYLLNRPTIIPPFSLDRPLEEFADHYRCDLIVSRGNIDITWPLVARKGAYHLYRKKP
jgi:hypothetical protein